MESTTTTTSKSVGRESEISKPVEERKAISSRPRKSKSASSSLKILHISDTHDRHKSVEYDFFKERYDVIVHSGDISSVGYLHDILEFLRWFTKLPAPYKIFIAGNHDRCFDWSIESERKSRLTIINELFREFKEGENFHYLENSGVDIEGVHFWGSPWTPRNNLGFWAFHKKRGEMNEIWSRIPSHTQVLITHGPVKGKLDFVPQIQENLGCEELGNSIKRIKPLLHLHGHIHESHGYIYSEGIYHFNSCIMDRFKFPINQPHLIEADFANKEVKIIQNG